MNVRFGASPSLASLAKEAGSYVANVYTEPGYSYDTYDGVHTSSAASAFATYQQAILDQQNALAGLAKKFDQVAAFQERMPEVRQLRVATVLNSLGKPFQRLQKELDLQA